MALVKKPFIDSLIKKSLYPTGDAPHTALVKKWRPQPG